MRDAENLLVARATIMALAILVSLLLIAWCHFLRKEEPVDNRPIPQVNPANFAVDGLSPEMTTDQAEIVCGKPISQSRSSNALFWHYAHPLRVEFRKDDFGNFRVTRVIGEHLTDSSISVVATGDKERRVRLVLSGPLGNCAVTPEYRSTVQRFLDFTPGFDGSLFFPGGVGVAVKHGRVSKVWLDRDDALPPPLD